MPYEAPMLGLQAALSAAAAPGEYVGNRQRGASIGRATAQSAFDFGLNALANPATLGAVMMGRILISAGAPGLMRSNENIRQTNTPFSQRFQHSRVTARLQAAALQQMSGMRAGGGISAMYGR